MEGDNLVILEGPWCWAVNQTWIWKQFFHTDFVFLGHGTSQVFRWKSTIGDRPKTMEARFIEDWAENCCSSESVTVTELIEELNAYKMYKCRLIITWIEH
ncbi:hypothetical protein XENOCAPTIV_023306 [Xenoophorus captivus]|uniref:Uncharacterized protein n=1 Tax=Xenoophorus captivus TaxID=1517983 RepID=A0ABV0RIP4_9TELE